MATPMTQNEPSLRLRGDSGQSLELRLIERMNPTSSDRWDGNWLRARILVRAGGFSADVTASLRSDDFPPFRDAVAQLDRTLKGSAEFRTIESWLALELEGDGRGHVELRGELVDWPGSENRLHFHIELDQTALAPLLRSLDEVIARFPVVG